MGEKTEKATPYKLQKAQEQGQVSKSAELNTCVNVLVILALVLALGEGQLIHLKTLMRQVLALTARMPFTVDSLKHLQQLLFHDLIRLWLPFALASVLSLILVTLAQTGIVWSVKPLTPDFKRLNPIQGLKRWFSSKLLFDALKTSAKLLLSIAFLCITIPHLLPVLLRFMVIPIANHPVMIIHLILKLLFQMLLLLSALALLDKYYTRWKYGKDQRMSKQERKEEHRQREGCPKIKSKIKQLQYQLRQKTASLKNIKTANVLITNPTHLAIALQYERHSMPAPKVVCKAQGELVHMAKKLARKHGIPIVENKYVARLLFDTSAINQWIPQPLFPVIAELLRPFYAPREQA